MSVSSTSVQQLPIHIWLRAESKQNERRSALTPNGAQKLLATGLFTITVERCSSRIFPDTEFELVGCTLVSSHSWITDAPANAIILGLKELPDTDTFPLSHTHIHFAHCYKGQSDWYRVLSRFYHGQGTLFDLEFLMDEQGRRVAAFGHFAGFAGAAVGLDVWSAESETERTNFPAIPSYPNVMTLVNHVKTRLALRTPKIPNVLVVGALGRCGKGAIAMLKQVGIPDTHIGQWDINETKDRHGPMTSIVTDYDIFINCIYLSSDMPPLITEHELNLPQRKLSVIVDVSCDPTSPRNPIPIYQHCSTFNSPTIAIHNQSLHVIAIDHLPSMLPRESSEQFVSDLLPSLITLSHQPLASVWKRAYDLFMSKLNQAKLEYPNEFASK